MKILVVGVLPSSLINFRGPLLRAMVDQWHVVCAAANGEDELVASQLQQIGVEYHDVQISRTGMNPFVDLTSLVSLVRLMRKVQPEVVLSYTIKPAIYGGIAAKICGVKCSFALVTGLGYAFMEGASLYQPFVGRAAKLLYRLSLRYTSGVFFQNPDDKKLLTLIALAPRM